MDIEKRQFGSTRQVLQHLDSAGYKISDSKIYRDKQAGLLRVNSDGSVDEAEVRAYASTLQRRGGNIDDLSDIHQRKADKEVSLLELKEKKLRFELDKDMGRYIPRGDFELELAARAVIFGTGLKHRVRSKITEWVALVAGKSEKGADLMECIEAEIEAELSEYATTQTFQVMFLED
jgi:hypothetical protein